MYHILKRLLDISVAITLAILFLPIWLIVPILIYLDSPGPIIFRHKRVGIGGEEFWLYKFRTMIKGADDFLHNGKDKELLKKFKKGDWKLKNDPRITKTGRVLRSLTIDEFPQLYNVLVGEMSMVGPRAYVKAELNDQQKKYPKTKKLIKTITSVKPGITGPWQTSGRNEIPFDKRAQMDAKYASNQSIVNDLVILLKTPQAMLSKW